MSEKDTDEKLNQGTTGLAVKDGVVEEPAVGHVRPDQVPAPPTPRADAEGNSKGAANDEADTVDKRAAEAFGHPVKHKVGSNEREPRAGEKGADKDAPPMGRPAEEETQVDEATEREAARNAREAEKAREQAEREAEAEAKREAAEKAKES